ncbi:hypothetical protein PV341_36275 [Streptomyces sp. PA03-1a]|nr:hypothetical protein [Streptomyces sp. PA03-1a]
MAAIIVSASSAAGALLGAARALGATVVLALMHKAPSLSELAASSDTTSEEQLRQARVTATLGYLPGLWICTVRSECSSCSPQRGLLGMIRSAPASATAGDHR